jgi:hypothetical protein
MTETSVPTRPVETDAQLARREIDDWRKATGKRPTTMSDDQCVRVMVEHGVDWLYEHRSEAAA